MRRWSTQILRLNIICLLVGYFLLFRITEQAIAENALGLRTTVSSASLRALHDAAATYRYNRTKPAVSLDMPTKSGTKTLRLKPTDIRAPFYKSEYTDDRGTHADRTIVDLFAGTLPSNDSKDFARLAIITNPDTGDEIIRGFVRADGVMYDVNPTFSTSKTLAVKELSNTELRGLIARCGSVTELAHSDALALPENQLSRRTGQTAFETINTTYQQTDLATEADFEYYQANGSNQTSSNAAILAIVNGVTAIYESQVGVTFRVTYQHTWTTSSDPYTVTDSSQLLTQFVNYWQANFSNAQSYDLAHLWTGRDIDSNVIGIAYLGTVCSSLRYGLSQRIGQLSYDVPLAAHEIGHNFDADHDTCSGGTSYIMCPSLVQNANTFSPASLSSINSFVASASCLTPVTGGGGGGGGGGTTPHAPVLAAIGNQSVQEYHTLSLALSATDADGDSVSYSVTPAVTGMTLSGATLTYTPAGNVVSNGAASATQNVTVTVTDATGLTDSENIVITITSNNMSPSITSPGTQSTSEGQLFSYTLQGTDPDGDSLTYSAPSGLPRGASFNSATGAFAWRPAGNQSGSNSITFRVTDTYGATAQTTLVLNVSDTPGVQPLPAHHAFGDFDGDGLSDASIYRQATGDWYSTVLNSSHTNPFVQKQFGLPGDLPVPADYNYDNITDYAVYRPSNHTWYITYSGSALTDSFSFGIDGDLPAPGDYNGDGRADAAVYRPSSGMFLYRLSTDGSTATRANAGGAGDIPVPCDYDGDSKTDIAFFRPTTNEWLVYPSTTGVLSASVYGQSGDIPVPADYDGNSRCDKAVWRPSDGSWYVEGQSSVQFGLGEDIPVPADYNGDGVSDFVVFRPSLALWISRNSDESASITQLGLPSDEISTREMFYYAARNSIGSHTLSLSGENRALLLYDRPGQRTVSLSTSGTTTAAVAANAGSYILSADYDGDGNPDTAVFGGGLWVIYQSTGGTRAQFWGAGTDIPVAGDFDGDGKADITVFRPDNGGGFSAWYAIRSTDGGASVFNWGLAGDTPVPADFNGDGWTDPAVWRSSTGTWYVLEARSKSILQAVQWGLPGDYPIAADFDSDGRPDKIVWRPANGTWYEMDSSGSLTAVQWGLSGDIPVPGMYVSSTRPDYAVYRASTRTLYIKTYTGATASVVNTTAPSAQPVDTSPLNVLN